MSVTPPVNEIVPSPPIEDCAVSVWFPPLKLIVPAAAGLKTPELRPPLLSAMVPVVAEIVPLLFMATVKAAMAVPAVLVSVPELLNVDGRPPLLVKMPELLKTEALVRNTPPPPLQKAEPALLTVRALKDLPALPLILNVAVLAAVVAPAPAKVPPDQLSVLLTVRVPLPSTAPPS